MDSLKHLDQLLKGFNIDSSELASVRAALDEVMTVSQAFTTAINEITRKALAQSGVQVPSFVLPAPDPVIEQQLAQIQVRLAEAMRPREPWEKDLDGALIQ